MQFCNFGLGERSETITLYSDCAGSTCASIYSRQLPDRDMNLTEIVTLKTLDEFCAQAGINHIHYLKLDVEGHELSVFRGATEMLAKGAIDWIQFEFGGCNIDARTYFRDFFALLSSQYYLYRLLRNGLAPIQQYHELLEVFTTTNFIAILKNLPQPNLHLKIK